MYLGDYRYRDVTADSDLRSLESGSNGTQAETVREVYRVPTPKND